MSAALLSCGEQSPSTERTGEVSTTSLTDDEQSEILLEIEDAYHTVINAAKADSAGKQFTIKITDGIPSVQT